MHFNSINMLVNVFSDITMLRWCLNNTIMIWEHKGARRRGVLDAHTSLSDIACGACLTQTDPATMLSCCADLSHQRDVCRTCHPAWAVKADERSRLGSGGPRPLSTGSTKEECGRASTNRICAGDSLRNVFVTLAAHLAAAGLRTWVSFVVLRAWTGRQFQSKRDTGSPAYKFGGITADEMEALCMTLCCVLPHLVDRELRELNTARRR